MRRGGEQLDPTGAVRDVGRYIREQRRQAELSLRNLASQTGVSNPYLSQIERGLRDPSEKVLDAIARSLELSAETLHTESARGKGREQDDADSAVIAAIRADRRLTAAQRQALLEVYRAFTADASVGGGSTD